MSLWKYEDYAKAKSLLNIMAEYFKVLGEYKNSKWGPLSAKVRNKLKFKA
jgi:hypothetical protein